MMLSSPQPRQTNEELLRRVEAGRVIAIVRGDYREHAMRIAETLLRAGVTALEITLNSPLALQMIETLCAQFGDDLLIGAGTVLTLKDVEAAAVAGAQFVLSPNRNTDVIRRTKKLGMLAFPGCLTCSEVVEAFDAGADAVKLFPAQMIGPSGLKAIRAPLGDIRTIPTGGISTETMPAYLEAGAWAFGVGSELVSETAKSTDGLNELFDRARRFANSARSFGR